MEANPQPILRGLLRKSLSLVRGHARVLSTLLSVSVLAFMGWRLVQDWRTLPPNFYAHVNPVLLPASLAALMPAMLLVSTRWWLTLRLMRARAGWWSSVRAWFLSQAGRYVPGGVWPYVSRFFLSRDEVGEDLLLTSMVLETALRVVSEICVFLLTLPFWLHTGFLDGRYTAVLLAVCGLGLLMLHPAVMDRCNRLPLLRRLGLKPVDLTHLRYDRVLTLLVYYAVTVVAVGAAFYVMVIAFYPLPLQAAPAVCGALSLAVVLGFLVPFVPNGWGVREGVLALLLSQLMPPAIAILVSGVARIWLTLGEGVWILLFLPGASAARRPHPSPPR